MPDSYFKGDPNFSDITISESLPRSALLWMDWCFINAGAFYNIHVPSSGNYGGDFSKLRPVSDPRTTNGRVWETYKSNLVWESGMKNPNINISGVYVNNTLISSGYTINYPLGLVKFDSAISTNSTVQMEFSAKHIKFIDANELPIFRQIQSNSYRVENPTYLSSSGDYAALAESRLQFPIVAIQTSNVTSTAYELGNYNLQGSVTILAHVLAETDLDVKRISDIIHNQKSTQFHLVDENSLAASGKIILDYNGNKTNTTMTYPEIINRFPSKECFIVDSFLEPIQTVAPDLYKRTVRLKTEIIF